jgi:hypothetical protein
MRNKARKLPAPKTNAGESRDVLARIAAQAAEAASVENSVRRIAPGAPAKSSPSLDAQYGERIMSHACSG